MMSGTFNLQNRVSQQARRYRRRNRMYVHARFLSLLGIHVDVPDDAKCDYFVAYSYLFLNSCISTEMEPGATLYMYYVKWCIHSFV